MSSKPSKQNTNTIKNDAATKIIGAFHKRIKLKIDNKIDVSMKGKAKSVRVVCVTARIKLYLERNSPRETADPTPVHSQKAKIF